MSEPISPELVLVDPKLARAERARLLALDYNETAPDIDRALPDPTSAAHVRALEAQLAALRVQLRELEGDVHTLEAQVPATMEQPASGWLRKRVASVVLPMSLIVNVILIAVAFAESRVDEPNLAPTSPRTTTSQASSLRPRHASVPKSHKPKAPSRRAVARAHKTPSTKRAQPGRAVTRSVTAGAVERKVLALVIQSPAGKLPSKLIDAKTGLAKNGLQAICRRSAARAFACVVRPTHHRPGEGLFVRYRVGGKGRRSFTWHPYRNGKSGGAS